jgi:hypothetical protein
LIVDPERNAHAVGPVLETGEVADAVITAIRELNHHVVIQDRGSYLRVLVPGRCVVTCEAIAAALGRPFCLPGDLEMIMPSFKGRFEVSEQRASWLSPTGDPAGGQRAAPSLAAGKSSDE